MRTLLGTLLCALGLARALHAEHAGDLSPADLRTRTAHRAPAAPPSSAGPPPTYVNWESPHVHPLDLTPDGTRLLAVNTADNRLEIFDVGETGLVPSGAIPVGLDPVTVRVRSDVEAWVVNHVSDSISIVDLVTGNVRATIPTGDEPADVVFAGDPERAFVSVSQFNEVRVFDPDDLAVPPVIVPIAGQDPRGLAVSGGNVYVAIFESGNGTTRVTAEQVSSPDSPYPDSRNPPPNDGDEFSPPIAEGLPTPPEVSMIVQREDGLWLDDNDRDWSSIVDWDLADHDVAVIDVATLDVQYVDTVMTTVMAITPGSLDDVAVVGTEAINRVRFEPNLRGIFVRSVGANVKVGFPPRVFDLNPHLDYSVGSMPPEERVPSIGDPRGVVFMADGIRAFSSGMGSNNVLVTGDGMREHLAVGQGPTGLVLDHPEERLYVLNRFDATISSIDVASFTELERVAFYDPTPEAVRAGRPFMYDTHLTSGLGQASCASCHVDSRWDALAWDLGDPSGEMAAFEGDCLGDCPDWHPMKGVMVTQSLLGIAGTGQFHWRGDRIDLSAFNAAFVGLQGLEQELPPEQMDQLVAFMESLTPPPNPYRAIDGSLRTTHPNGGNPAAGEIIYTEVLTCLVPPRITCNFCHALPTGTSGFILPSEPLSGQPMKISHLQAVYEKTGFDPASTDNAHGFGIFHDGTFGSLPEELAEGPLSESERLDVEAFVFSLSTATHAGVGVQATLGGPGPDQTALRDELVEIASNGDVGLVAKGLVDGEQRGFYLDAGLLQSDRAGETWTIATLDLLTEAGAEVTYTAIPVGTEIRIGVDRDEDGFFDRDEIDGCADPADPESVPDPRGCCPADVTGDGQVAFDDLLAILSNWGPCGDGCPADVDRDGFVAFEDLLEVISAWGPCPIP